MLPPRFEPVLAELAPLAARFRERGHRLYLVGGTVRDLLGDSGRDDFDLDLTTDARPDEIKACNGPRADAIWSPGEPLGPIGAKSGERPYHITPERGEI
jgi:poly(A) polymerase